MKKKILLSTLACALVGTPLRAEYLPVALLDTPSLPILANNLQSYLETARLVDNPDSAQAMLMRVFMLPDYYKAPHEPAVCHWIYDTGAGAMADGMRRVVVIPASDRGEALVKQLRNLYGDVNVRPRDGFWICTPAAGLPPLALFNRAGRMWISSDQKTLLWAALNEHALLPRPQESPGLPWFVAHPANLLAYLESPYVRTAPLAPDEPLYWVRALGFAKPLLEAFQGIWLGVTLDRNAVGLDFRMHVKTFSEAGQWLTSWPNPGAKTEAYIPVQNTLALITGIPDVVDSPPCFGTLGRGMKDFAMYVAETRAFGPYLAYVAEIQGDDADGLAGRLGREITSLQLIPGTRVVPTRKRVPRQGPEVYTFRLESTAPEGNLFSAPLKAACSALVGECWVQDRHIFATLAVAPAAETVIQQGARRAAGLRSTTLDRVRRGLQKLPERIRFALVASPSSMLRASMMRMPGADQARLGAIPTVSDGFTLAIAEERYAFLRVYMRINSTEINTLREIFDRGQPVIRHAAGEIQKQGAK